MATIYTGITFSPGIQFTGGYTFTNGLATGDPYWQYVSYLSQTSATNAAQNNTFLDASTNNFTITRNGSTTQGSAAPFGANWSNYFLGGTSQLSVATNAAFNYGTGNFTWEMWFNPAVIPSSVYLLDHGTNGGTLSFNPTRCGYYSPTTGISSTLYTVGFGNSFTPGVWYHIAAVRISGVTYLYLNGTLTTSASDTTNYGSNSCLVGQYGGGGLGFNGYISNVRIVNGTGVYTANFTPPTNALTPITNTSLLTCQSPAFQDNSANAFALTTAGTLQVQRFSPFANYLQSPTTYSAKFNGSSDYLSLPANSAFNFGTSNLTMEAWIYPTTVSGNIAIFSFAGDIMLCGIQAGVIVWYVNGIASGWAGNTQTVVANQWSHIACVRNGTTCSFYLNGVASTGNSTHGESLGSSSAVFSVGFRSGFTSFPGYISNFRVVNGTALYTTNFTPPTAPLTAITNTSLLTCQSTTIVDNSTNAFALTTTGSPTPYQYNPFGYTNTTSPQQTYDPTVYGGSMYFNGAGTDYLTVASSTAYGTLPANGSFTIEGYFYFTDLSLTQQCVFTQRTSTNAYVPYLIWATTTTVTLYVSSNNTSWDIINGATIATGLVTNQWYHFAYTRSGSTFRFFVNGVQTYTFTSSAAFANTGTFNVGMDPGETTTALKGFVSNVRFVNGTAVYTSNFVPSLTPLTAVTNTQLLLNGTNAGIYDASMINDQVTVSGAKTSTSIVKYGSSSMAFNGSTDYITMPSSTNLTLGAGDFTIEGWVYTTVANQTYGSGIMGTYDGGSNGGWSLTINRSTGATYGIVFIHANAIQQSYSTYLSTNTWYYIAITRASGTLRTFLNGTQVATGTYATADTVLATCYVGSQGVGQYLNGNISDLRITKGYARYTSNFAVPTLSLPDYGSTQGSPTSVDYLVVAGGGAGATGILNTTNGGAGGAGGLIYSSSVSVTPGVTYPVVVGQGGLTGSPYGTNGGNSSFNNLIAIGGGGGASVNASGTAALSGGSGGGGVGLSGGTNLYGGAGTYSQGNAGGAGTATSPYTTGSGGGAGGSGGNGAGGIGLAYSISGASVTYAGGGGSGVNGSTVYAGGLGGGGAGGNDGGTTATAGTPNFGGGGGGSSGNNSARPGGAGGSGIVIIRYPDSYSAATATTGSPTITVTGGYRIYAWTTVGSGSITF